MVSDSDGQAIARLTWADFAPDFARLERAELNAGNIAEWLADWTQVADRAEETSSRLNVATTVNTADTEADELLNRFLDESYPEIEAANQRLKERLLQSVLSVPGFEIPLRNMRSEAALFRESNLSVQVQEQKLGLEYDKVVGAQTVSWQGEERTLAQMGPFLRDPQRDVRESAWRLTMDRWQEDRAAINDLWAKFLDVRLQIAANADYGRDYRAYAWERFQRFDYTPANCRAFHDAIEQEVVPVVSEMLERRRQRLGLDALRPWDLDVDIDDRPPLEPFSTSEELIAGAARVFDRLDSELAAEFQVMRDERLLDLESRKNKAPGGYCTSFPVRRQPFIFMNAAGLHQDVQTMLHECGHAFHVFATAPLPYAQQLATNTEFAEVASMSMELLGSPYLEGAYYNAADAKRARIQHLEKCLAFWPYMAVVDAFQHWVYENPDSSGNSDACDTEWARLWERFMPGVDWSGLESVRDSGWHRKLHIHQIPFYYVEYGIAQLGAYQVYARSKTDESQAVRDYRAALALGGTATLPDLFRAAGAELRFDASTLSDIVALIKSEIANLSE